jgi:cytochrome c-type biogenesis protein CcmH
MRMGMKRIQQAGLIILALLLPQAVSAVEAVPVAEDPVLEQRMISLSEDLRCLVCQNESLAGSHADLAQDLRQEIRDQMRSGKSDEQVVDYLTQRYGDFVLYKPPLKPLTWLLWFGPFVLLFGTAGGFYFYLKRRGTRLASESLSAEEKKRVEELLGNNGNES